MTRKRLNPNQLELALPLMAARMPTPLSRATSKRGSRREAPAPKPWQCVILAVDTARRSGWSIYVLGKLVASGEVETVADGGEAALEQLVRQALELAVSVPCLLVLEAPWGGSVDVVSALGAARERWLRAWRACAQAKARVLLVLPSEWRGPVLGSEWVSAPRHEVRAHELRTARALAGGIRRYHEVRGHDEAAAILIGRWAAHAAAVGRSIGKRAAKRSMRVWCQQQEASR